MTKEHLQGSICFICGMRLNHTYGHPVVCMGCKPTYQALPVADKENYFVSLQL